MWLRKLKLRKTGVKKMMRRTRKRTQEMTMTRELTRMLQINLNLTLNRQVWSTRTDLFRSLGATWRLISTPCTQLCRGEAPRGLVLSEIIGRPSLLEWLEVREQQSPRGRHLLHLLSTGVV